MDEDLISDLNNLTGFKYSRSEVVKALQEADEDIDDALNILIEQEKPKEMFAAGVVSKKTKQ